MTDNLVRVALLALAALFDARLETLNRTLAEQTELPRHDELKWAGGTFEHPQGPDVVALDEMRDFGELLREAIDALEVAR